MPHLTEITRRGAFGLFVGVSTFALARPSLAFGGAEAEDFVKTVIADLRSLVTRNASADDFLGLLDRKGAIPQVGKFAMGRNWREMSGGQQDTYQAAFRGYISRTYARRFGDYNGEDIVVTGSTDAGRKGVLVKSVLKSPNAQDATVEWLVTDRLGPPKIADIIFEGISLSITLREVFGGMVDQRNGDIDLFIQDLNASEGA